MEAHRHYRLGGFNQILECTQKRFHLAFAAVSSGLWSWLLLGLGPSFMMGTDFELID